MKKTMCIWMVLSLIGCTTTTFKTVEHLEVSLPDIIVVGETYRFTTNSSGVFKMKVIEVSAKKVVGTLESGYSPTINAADILSIEVETIDDGQTTLAIIGGTTLVAVAAVVAAAVVLAAAVVVIVAGVAE
jgi:hypothetical protein